jgi:transcriptional regulator GlxA family with amidase domain
VELLHPDSRLIGSLFRGQRFLARERIKVDSRLIRAIETLSSDPSQRMRLPELARQTGLSVRMLELLFQIHTEKTFSHYYRDLRIAIAKDMLANTDEPVKVISPSLGYKAVEVFCRDFKRVCGHTPLEFRRRCRQVSLQNKSIDCI